MATERRAQIEGGVVVNVIEVVQGQIPDFAKDWPVAPTAGPGWTYDGSTFAAPVAPAPDAALVKAEAYRRIVAIVPEWRQRNLTARASILAEKGRANWSAGELAEWDAGSAIWEDVAAIRAASDVIEALDPIPADFADDTHWP